jgi:hypothetical protein
MIRVNSMVSLAALVFLGVVLTTESRAEMALELKGLSTHTEVARQAQTDTSGFQLRRLVPRSYRHSLQGGMYDLRLQGVGARISQGKRRGNGGLDVRVKVGFPEDGKVQDTDTGSLVTPTTRLNLREPAKGPLFMLSIGTSW